MTASGLGTRLGMLFMSESLKPEITEEQKALILAVACEPPSQSGYPHTHWTDRLLAREVIRRGIVETISHVWIWAFLRCFENTRTT